MQPPGLHRPPTAAQLSNVVANTAQLNHPFFMELSNFPRVMTTNDPASRSSSRCRPHARALELWATLADVAGTSYCGTLRSNTSISGSAIRRSSTKS